MILDCDQPIDADPTHESLKLKKAGVASFFYSALELAQGNLRPTLTFRIGG